nr:hypothetical protein [Tanacetum cinerariifolium]
AERGNLQPAAAHPPPGLGERGRRGLAPRPACGEQRLRARGNGRALRRHQPAVRRGQGICAAVFRGPALRRNGRYSWDYAE